MPDERTFHFLTDQVDKVIHREHLHAIMCGGSSHFHIPRELQQQRGHVCSGGKAMTCWIEAEDCAFERISSIMEVSPTL